MDAWTDGRMDGCMESERGSEKERKRAPHNHAHLEDSDVAAGMYEGD